MQQLLEWFSLLNIVCCTDTQNPPKSEWDLQYILNKKKLRKSQKTMEQKNTKDNNCSIFIYLLRYISSVEKMLPLVC